MTVLIIIIFAIYLLIKIVKSESPDTKELSEDSPSPPPYIASWMQDPLNKFISDTKPAGEQKQADVSILMVLDKTSEHRSPSYYSARIDTFFTFSRSDLDMGFLWQNQFKKITQFKNDSSSYDNIPASSPEWSDVFQNHLNEYTKFKNIVNKGLTDELFGTDVLDYLSPFFNPYEDAKINGSSVTFQTAYFLNTDYPNPTDYPYTFMEGAKTRIKSLYPHISMQIRLG